MEGVGRGQITGDSGHSCRPDKSAGIRTQEVYVGRTETEGHPQLIYTLDSKIKPVH